LGQEYSLLTDVDIENRKRMINTITLIRWNKKDGDIDYNESWMEKDEIFKLGPEGGRMTTGGNYDSVFIFTIKNRPLKL
jgi:hypothetical protein